MKIESTRNALHLVCQAIERCHVFVVTTLMNPDGDGLGAEAALAEALEQLGKQVHVINNGPTPDIYRFLHGTSRFQRYDPQTHRELLLEADTVILLDAALPKRAS